MPLPDDPSMPWPPKSSITVQDHYDTWAAWYSGSPDALAEAYGDPTSIVSANSKTARSFFEIDKPGARHGFRGLFQRWFWGSMVPAGEQRTKLHIPVAGDIAAISADLLYAEPPDLTAQDASAQTQAQIGLYLEDGLWGTLRESAEVGAAMGGVYLRVVWDDAIRERPWLAPVSPELAVPEWRWDTLSAVTFWRFLESSGNSRDVVRHLERHEPGAVLHGVYVGDKDKLGRRASLADFPETADIAESLDNEDMIATGYKRLTAGYIPNMRPNRVWQGKPEVANLGRSDYSGVEGLFDSIDEIFSSWMRDLRLGKARLIVPQSALVSLGKGKGATIDVDQEIIVPLNLGPSPDSKLDQVQFDIRWEAHQATLQFAVETAVRDAGYSMQSLSSTGDVAMTATEVTSRERRSMLTRGRKIQYNTPVLRDLITALLAVDVAKFGPQGVAPVTPAIEWPKNVFIDPMDAASTVQLLRDARVVSVDTAVRMIHPDWDDDMIEAELIRLQVEDTAAGIVSGVGSGTLVDTGDTSDADVPVDEQPGELD